MRVVESNQCARRRQSKLCLLLLLHSVNYYTSGTVRVPSDFSSCSLERNSQANRGVHPSRTCASACFLSSMHRFLMFGKFGMLVVACAHIRN